jgi:hypothetical protein
MARNLPLYAIVGKFGKGWLNLKSTQGIAMGFGKKQGFGELERLAPCCSVCVASEGVGREEERRNGFVDPVEER